MRGSRCSSLHRTSGLRLPARPAPHLSTTASRWPASIEAEADQEPAAGLPSRLLLWESSGLPRGVEAALPLHLPVAASSRQDRPMGAGAAQCCSSATQLKAAAKARAAEESPPRRPEAAGSALAPPLSTEKPPRLLPLSWDDGKAVSEALAKGEGGGRLGPGTDQTGPPAARGTAMGGVQGARAAGWPARTRSLGAIRAATVQLVGMMGAGVQASPPAQGWG